MKNPSFFEKFFQFFLKIEKMRSKLEAIDLICS